MVHSLNKQLVYGTVHLRFWCFLVNVNIKSTSSSQYLLVNPKQEYIIGSNDGGFLGF